MMMARRIGNFGMTIERLAPIRNDGADDMKDCDHGGDIDDGYGNDDDSDDV
jgi:hypothetical protein